MPPITLARSAEDYLDVLVFIDLADRPIWSGVIVFGEPANKDAAAVLGNLLPEPEKLLDPTGVPMQFRSTDYLLSQQLAIWRLERRGA